MPNTDMLEVKLRASSQEDAQAQAAAVVKALHDIHQQVLAPSVDEPQAPVPGHAPQLDSVRAAAISF